MDSYLSQVYLRISECNELYWNLDSVPRFLILNLYILHNPHIRKEEYKKSFIYSILKFVTVIGNYTI